jgi:hypothetical protein
MRWPGRFHANSRSRCSGARQLPVCMTCEPLDRRMLMVAGDPDPAFANGFPATINFPGASFQVNDVALQADGKVIAAGTKAGSLAVTRFNVDGTLAARFGQAIAPSVAGRGSDELDREGERALDDLLA